MADDQPEAAPPVEEVKPEEPKPAEPEPEVPKEEAPKEEPPKEEPKEEPPKEEPKAEPAKEEPKEEPKPEAPKEEAPKEELKPEPPKEEPKEEPPKEEPKPEPPKEEAPKEEPKEEPKAEPEPPKEEPKAEPKEEPKAEPPKEEPKEEPPKEEAAKDEPKEEAKEETPKEEAKVPPPTNKAGKPKKVDSEAPEEKESPKEEDASPKLEEGDEKKVPPPTNKAGKPKLAKPEEAEPEKQEPEKPATLPKNKVGALAMGLKIPMPGMAPPKAEEKADAGISFDQPVAAAPLVNVTKNRTQLPNRTQKVPTRPTRIYLSDGSHKGVPIKVDATAQDVIDQMVEKMEIPEDQAKKYEMYVIKADGSETKLDHGAVLTDVSNSWDDKQLYKFFFKKKGDPPVIKVNPGFFESSAFPTRELPQVDVTDEGGMTKSASQMSDLKDKGKEDKVKKSESKQSLAKEEKVKKSESKQSLAKEEKVKNSESKQTLEEPSKAKKSESSHSVKALAEGDETGASSSSATAPAAASSAPPPEKKKAAYLKKVEVTVAAKQGNVTCEIVGKPSPKPFPIRLTDVVGVKTEERTTELEKFTVLNIHYLDHTRKGKTQVLVVSVDFTDPQAAEELKKQIEAEIAGTTQTSLSHVAVIVNPLCGKKKGESIYQKYLGPLFDAIGVKVTKKACTSPGSAQKIAEELDISSIKAIICVSGDGTVRDVLNGLLKRKDWVDAMNIPVGVICAGHSNSLAFALQGHEKALDATLTALQFLKAKTQRLDIMSVTKGTEVSYSIAGQHFGFLDEAPARFTATLDSKFKGLISKPKFPDHPCKLSLLVVSDDKAKLKGGSSSSSKPTLEESDLNRDPMTRKLVAMDKEVTDWKVIENVAGLIASKLPWNQKGYQMTPYASFTDGLVDVCVVNAGAGKVAGPRILKLSEVGQHVDAPGVQYFKVKGYRLEPKGPSQVYVDGESIGNSAIQVEVHHSVFTTFAF